MKARNFETLYSHMDFGKVYRREDLLPFSHAIDRDLSTLKSKGMLEKLSGGIYYKPKFSRFGKLPPSDEELVAAFLGRGKFLLYSWNQYNSLGLGLTQLYNKLVIYNLKRHGLFKLGNKVYDFRRPNSGFPNAFTPEFLLVDLLNNLDELAEDPAFVKKQIKNNLDRFDVDKVKEHALTYGKVATKHFFNKALN
ncbi:MAG: DUF6088 family protein [Pseudomonadota bacterium]